MTSSAVARSWTHALSVLLAVGAPAARAQVSAAPAAETPRPRSAAEEPGDAPVFLGRGSVVRETDLASHFSSGPAKAAAAELQAGRPSRALQLLASAPKDVPTHWLRALSLRAAGHPVAARRLFEALAVYGGPLADRATHLAALSAIDAGDSKLAETLLSQVSLRYVDADQALLERARLIAKLRPARVSTAQLVEQTLGPIFSGSVPADLAAAHLIAGDTQLAAGDREAARVHYRAAWVEHPLSGAAESARQRERALLPPGSPVAPLLLIKRAEILIEAHRNRDALDQLSRLKLPSLCAGGCPGDRTPAAFLQAALALLAPDALPRPHEVTPEDVARGVLEPADGLACRAKLDQGRALRKGHEYVKSRLALAPVVLRCADPDLRARALYLLAQMETLGARPNAGPLWEALARKFPQSSLADDALYYEALARHRAGDLPSEQLLLTQLINEHLDSDLRTEAIFRLFWSLRREGKAREGLTWLDVLAAHPDPEGAEEERARYWRARTLLETEGQDGTGEGATLEGRAAAVEAARADLLWLIQERPLTYHGLLARGRMADLDPAASRRLEETEERAVLEGMRTTGAPLHAGVLGLDPHLRAGIELLRLGLKAEAAREFSAVDRRPARIAGEQGREPLVLLADLTARAADTRGAHQIVRVDLQALLRHPVRGLSLRAASLAYPLAFRDQIAKSAQSAAIPPDLLQALMREESALDPRALSSTGAIGLTQLMPNTAKAVAHKLGIGAVSTAQLLEPAINIRIGGSYLGELHAHFGHPALALAAYNAGPGAVAGWLRARGALPLDAFVEEIPLEETRGYVKRCLRSFAAYQFLYGSGSARLPHVGQTLASR
jgi:soluble lytic murein transglycosylase